MDKKDLKILIADDDFSTRKILRAFLDSYGEIDTTVDGEETLFAFKIAHKEHKPYNLICLDIMMPKMDGQQVLKEIRAYEDEKEIRGRNAVNIIMTTALDDPKNIMDAFKAQCEAYITKPVEKDEILKAIKKLGLI